MVVIVEQPVVGAQMTALGSPEVVEVGDGEIGRGKSRQAATASDENIIRRFAAISLLQQRHTVPKPFPITERFRPAERCISCTDYSLSECFERNRGARQLLQTGPPPVYQPVPLYPPVQLQLQVESLMEARARVLQMQAEKNQFIRMHSMRKISGLDRFAGNRFLPFGGSGNGESSSGRDYGGTGVFLPRVHTTNINNNGGKRRGKSIILLS
ncbi:hypothetical protein K7X08_007819 [Anisodus acutangulus]|uniref:Uncharacterized protein n=1 Tax=Anisodus acutangulus TaxID=402998 RepID=A0A9Q1MSI5_9SOLA|nr:hypothetical protein K7X08_007819 [Anisodus acutangulus]